MYNNLKRKFFYLLLLVIFQEIISINSHGNFGGYLILSKQ